MLYDWDSGNINKNLVTHNVHDWEIEEAIEDQNAKAVGSVFVNGEERIELLGRVKTNGRFLRVIFTYRTNIAGNILIRPISATDMTERQKRRYLRK
jgi:uncharacterized DUF497 family protein